MTRTKYGLSPWVDLLPRKRRLDFPRYRGSLEIPVAIVGGGLTGCCTAYALAAAGVKVALLEADRLGLAGAARGAGVLQPEAALSYRDLEAQTGRRAARAMFEASRRAVLDLASTVRRLGIKAGVETHDAVRLVTAFSAGEKVAARDTVTRRDVGLDGVWLKSAQAAREAKAEHTLAGVRLHDWGQSDPYRLVMGFAAAASTRGAHIFERSAVRRIKSRRKNVEIHAEGGVLTAGTVIIATGEPTDLFRPLKRHVQYGEQYAVLTDPLPASIRKALATVPHIVTDTDTPPHVIRRTADDRLLVLGAAAGRTPLRGRDKVLAQRTGQLMYEALRLYPAISGAMPRYGWDLPVCQSGDGAMYAGPHRNFPGHLFAWATRHDPAQCFLASRILTRHVLDETDRDDAYFAFTRG